MPPPPQRTADWSDGETSVLISAWGPTQQRRRGGRLDLKDWRAVASAVNAHGAAAGRRYNRTRAQCQNRVQSLKRRYKRELLSAPPPPAWRHFPRLRAFLADPDGPPPGFAAVQAQASVKEEVVETNGQDEVEVGAGIVLAPGSWSVPRKPRNESAGAAGLCPAAVVTKLAEVYERVELARLSSEKVKMEVEAEKAMFDAVKMEY